MLSVQQAEVRGLWQQVQEQAEAICERDRRIRVLEGQLARLKQNTTSSTEECAMTAIEVRESPASEQYH